MVKGIKSNPTINKYYAQGFTFLERNTNVVTRPMMEIVLMRYHFYAFPKGIYVYPKSRHSKG